MLSSKHVPEATLADFLEAESAPGGDGVDQRGRTHGFHVLGR